MDFKILIALGLGGFASLASADVFSGTVNDSATSNPINQVAVSVNTDPPQSTFTDANGNFTLTATTSIAAFAPKREQSNMLLIPKNGVYFRASSSGDASASLRDARGAQVDPDARLGARSISNPASIYASKLEMAALGKSSADVTSHILTFVKAGYRTETRTVSGSQSGLQVKMVSQPGQSISFNPPAGPYYSATPVTIASSEAGAAIYYTTDGTLPTPTHGTLYSGPVTMATSVNADYSAATINNASGVTMLKAAAFKNGSPVGEVFTGNYIIINPLRNAKRSSLLLGLAHMAYNVSSANWSSILSLWTNYLGFEAVTTSADFALIKINDQQFIELYKGTVAAPKYQLANFGFYVSDAEAFRQQLAKNGVTVPAACKLNALGNLSFITTDPDGHANEWVQYMPGSVTSLTLGRNMPGTQLFGYLECYGIATGNVTTIDGYYAKCDLTGSSTKMFTPNNNCYLEMLTYKTLDQTEAGKHEKAQLVNFRGQTLLQTMSLLKARDPSITQFLSTEGGSGSMPTHDCGDLYNADLSRIRLIDVNY